MAYTATALPYLNTFALKLAEICTFKQTHMQISTFFFENFQLSKGIISILIPMCLIRILKYSHTLAHTYSREFHSIVALILVSICDVVVVAIVVVILWLAVAALWVSL